MPKSPTAKKPSRIWRDPETLAGQNEELEIVRALKGVILQSQWERLNAISFTHLTLKRALNEAIRRQDQRANADHEYWAEIERFAVSALGPLRALIAHIGPDGVRYHLNADGYGRLKVQFIMQNPDGSHMGKTYSKAELDLLTSAAKTIASIRTTAVNFRMQGRKAKGAEIEHDKHGFVFRLAEAWIYLTGRLPGGGKERNPFLRFVEAAAADAGVKTTGFYTGLQAAIAHLKCLEQSLAGKKSLQSISGIREFGPEWAQSQREGNK